jgi:hypothetical protein
MPVGGKLSKAACVISSATEAPSFAWLRPEGKPRNRIALRYSGGGAGAPAVWSPSGWGGMLARLPMVSEVRWLHHLQDGGVALRAFGTQIVFAAQPTLVAFASVGIRLLAPALMESGGPTNPTGARNGTRADGVLGWAAAPAISFLAYSLASYGVTAAGTRRRRAMCQQETNGTAAINAFWRR